MTQQEKCLKFRKKEQLTNIFKTVINMKTPLAFYEIRYTELISHVYDLSITLHYFGTFSRS